MIYLNDIQTVDDHARIAQYAADAKSFLEDVTAQAFEIQSQADSMRAFGIYTEDAATRTGNAFMELCKAIGNKIMEVIQRATDFVAGMIQRIKHASWEKSSDVEKFQQLARKNPKAAEQVKIAVTAGELDFMNYSDFADFYKNIDTILADIRAAHADPKTIRGKWQKLKHKYLTKENVKIAATVIGTTVTATVSIITLINKINDKKKEAKSPTTIQENMLAELRLTNQNLVKTQQAVEDTIVAANGAHYGRMQIFNEIVNTVETVGNKQMVADFQLTKKIRDACEAAVNNPDRVAGLDALTRNTLDVFSAARAAQNMQINALTAGR